MRSSLVSGSVRACRINKLIALMSLTLFSVLLITTTISDINYFSKLIPYVFYLKNKSTVILHNDSVKPICSLQFLKQYATEHHSYSSFPFEQIGTNRTILPSGDYSCWFPIPEIRRNLMTTCDACKNVSRILVLGDSNGRRYTDSMMTWLEKSSWSCKIVKEGRQGNQSHQTSGYLPDPKYFVREPMIMLDHIKYRSRDCHSCTSIMHECTHSSGQNLSVEYLAVQNLLDSEITTFRTGNMCIGRIPCDQSDTHQEFIFREYLADRYPDILFYIMNSHDLGRHTLKRIKISADYFFNIIDSYIPSASVVILLSSMKRMLSPGPRQLLYENKLNMNDKQLAINQIVYESAESRLRDLNKQWYAFPDLYDRSNTTDHMYKDHVHRTSVWYQYITNYLLQLICFL